MKTLPYLIALLCLFQVSIYAQSTGQVTISIRLYPIQAIELEPTYTQTLEVSNPEVSNSFNQSPSSQFQLSTYSTSQFEVKVDTILNDEAPPIPSESQNTIIVDKRYDNDTKNDLFHVRYTMEAM